MDDEQMRAGGGAFPGAGMGEDEAIPEPVWTYRGYKLRASEFSTAMVHFFRAEISRANVWRQRLDATTNWAVVTTGAALSLSFGQVEGHHAVLILNTLLITMFLVIEARRYRYYELFASRVRLMETDFFAAMLVPPFSPSPDWAESLAENLLQPHFPISVWEAIGRRFRRNYLYIFVIMGMAWFAKLWLHPVQASSLAEMTQRAAIGSLPGEMVFGMGVLFYVTIFTVGLLTYRLQQATGEVLPRYGVANGNLKDPTVEMLRPRSWRAWFRPSEQRRQLLALAITDRPQDVGQGVLDEMKRGVTELSGRGMFTGKAHSVLMCALTVTEVAHFKSIVDARDPNAFVVVTPAQEVLGKGFMPLGNDK